MGPNQTAILAAVRPDATATVGGVGGSGESQSGRAMKIPTRVGSEAIERRSPVGTNPRPR